MIALYRAGIHLRQVKLVPNDRAEELLNFALPGDTLHNVPEEMSCTASDVLRCIQNNLESGYFEGV